MSSPCVIQIILTAGAINTPRLLMASGIGDSAHLTEVGIESKCHLPGVGRNLIDHPAVGVVFEISGDLLDQFPSAYNVGDQLEKYRKVTACR